MRIILNELYVPLFEMKVTRVNKYRAYTIKQGRVYRARAAVWTLGIAPYSWQQVANPATQHSAWIVCGGKYSILFVNSHGWQREANPGHI